ncbi:hypothetical protein PMAYCL1PPCAC_10736, partial [Pristionchus mayeri]
GDFGFRKQCTVNANVIVGCISLRGTFIKRGENHTEYSDEQCDPVTACIAIGNDETGFREKAFCGASTLLTRSPPTEKTNKPTDKPTRETPATVKPTEPTKKTPPTVKPTERPVTDAPTACPDGKKEGDEWNQLNTDRKRYFRKKCQDGCVVTIGCVSQRNSTVPRGTNKTEYYDEDCDLITACIAINATATRIQEDTTATKETVVSLKPTDPTKKPTPTEKPTDPTKKPTPSGKPTDPTKKPTPTDKLTDPTKKPTPTEKPTDPTKEKNKEGTREFRKKCVDGCVVIIGCYSKKNTLVPRGQNTTEYLSEECYVVTACIAVGASITTV